MVADIDDCCTGHGRASRGACSAVFQLLSGNLAHDAIVGCNNDMMAYMLCAIVNTLLEADHLHCLHTLMAYPRTLNVEF
eukprot:213604-Chlamydomonas_euryale.AAC.32